MESTSHRAIAIVGAGAILPDAANVSAFWENVKNGRYSITEVDRDRWDPALYFDSDHSAPDKTYSTIGGWVRDYVWDPLKWRLGVPPRVISAMDESQKWAIACTREALEDYGFPKRPLNTDRTAVILGNAMAGEKHYFTALRLYFPEYAHELAESVSFAGLPETLRRDIARELHDRMADRVQDVTEDTMPGELANCIAGRIANIFNFHGPNYVVDAACASAMAAISAAVEGLVANDFDIAVTGGIDRNMGVSSYIKFCKIGALSATGTRPYAEGADGFVMGEGTAIFLLKRLADAERDGDKIYAVLRGIAGASDGKGKGITAPNPAGQKLAIERAWLKAGLSPSTVSLIEGHGTSTAVGDVVEVQSMIDVLSSSHLPPHSVALGSVKSNLGHLKGAAGAAGLLKAALALRDKVLPPSVHCEHRNPNIDFAHSPLYVNTELKPWTMPADSVRRAGLSAFGFGGTNFHAVLEEYIPHRLNGNGNGKRSVAVNEPPTTVKESIMNTQDVSRTSNASPYKAPLRGALILGAASEPALVDRLRAVEKNAKAGKAPAPSAPAESDLRAPERVAIDYSDANELATKAGSALKALAANQPAVWKALRAQGIFRGHGPAPKVAFLYTGQGSQYANMLKLLRDKEPIVAETFAEADRIMTPLLGKPLTEYIFVDQADATAVAKAEEDLRQTEITQPAVLAIDLALTRLLAAYGIEPDFTMGHSLGEYGALVAAGGLPFTDSLEAVSARGRGMTQVAMDDNGRMAAVFAPLEEVERILKTINGYVVIANFNSSRQAVVGGASKPVEQAMEAFQKAGYDVAALPVSHAFHTTIVAGASKPLRQVLERLHLQSPRLPIVANTNGEFYPTGPDVVPKMLDILTQQVASPVQFIKGLGTLYDAGARMFVEVGPKKALQGFAEDVLGGHSDVVSLFTNHPKVGDIVAFNQALCGLYAAGLGRGTVEAARETSVTTVSSPVETPKPIPVAASATSSPTTPVTPSNGDRYNDLGHLFADVLDRGYEIYRGQKGVSTNVPVVITGAALGLPGTEHVFDDANIARILQGEQFIKLIPPPFRKAMLDKHITRLVKSESGEARFETLTDVADVIKLAGRQGAFDLGEEFGISSERVGALDIVTQLAIAAGIDALRDAGIPLVMRYKTTTKGTQLPERWGLPDALRDDTGVIFASAFPGYDSFADEMARYYADHERRGQLATLESLLAGAVEGNGHSTLVQELKRRIEELRVAIDKEPYVFNRRFLLRVLSMGHSQFAEFIGARGPNTQLNAACASTTQAVSLAQDWIHAGRCNRVIVVSADDVTSDHLIEWMGAGFLATGAAATDEVVADAAIPFDRRRHGMLIGMGAAALVVESADAVRARGIQPICEVLSTTTNNSAFHGTRLDVQHIGQVMETLVSKAEAQSGISRRQIASQTVFVSHETYTPARGGSASAEIHALRRVFGDVADSIVIANTKGFTGHAMGTGIEDVVAVKALETGCVPPVANFKEVDPELGKLNLSKGGSYPVEYAIHLGAGFGSQISMMLLHWVKTKDGIRRSPNALGYAYRIADATAWSAWLSGIAGRPAADLEVVHRTLRVRDQGLKARVTEVAQASHPAQAPVPIVQVPSPATPVLSVKPEPKPVLTKVTEPTVKVPVAVAAPSASPTPAAKGEPVKEKVLALVAEKTGYPVDMLDLDLDLEADLGVDTVKQAEFFAAIREIYNIPRDENRKLRDYPTLAHVIRFVYEKRPDLAAAPAATKEEVKSATPKTAVEAEKPAPAATPAPGSAGEAVKERILALVVEKTGYPKDMLDLDLDLEADLGVDTVKQAELFAAIREIYSIPRDESRKLRDYPTLAHVIRFVFEKRPDLAAAPAAEKEEVKPATPTTAAAEKPAPAPGSVSDSVKERILALVVDKTGYPKDMLDLDLDLEADLGVDTVKQAEMFAAIREIYSIPRDENRKLRDYPTLTHVIRFVFEKRPDLAAAPVAAKEEVELATPTTALVTEEPVPAATSIEIVAADAVKERILALVVEKTGYPKDMLDLELDLEADLGVDTVKQAEMFAAIREIYGIPRDENRKLRDYPTLAHVIRFVFEGRPDLAGTVPAASVAPSSATPTETPAPPSGAVPTVTDDAIKEKVLEIVAEKSGYPRDMLDLDLDLEADLGIDTVKQAEMFAAVRAAYNIPRDENLKLREFPTLAHVIKFAHDRQPGAIKAASPSTVFEKTASAPKKPVAPAASGLKPIMRPIPASFDAANRIPRRVPVPNLRPPIDLCKPTGVNLCLGRRVVVVSDKSGVADALMQRLRALDVEILRIELTLDAEQLAKRLKTCLAAGPIHGVYWLPALDNEGSITQMDLATWHENLRVRVKSLYVTMRMLYEQIAAPSTFLVAATRFGGQHGYDEAGAVAPLGGAVVGFSKTYKRERLDALVKAVDFEVEQEPSEVADILIEETLRDPGAVEIGYKQGLRWTVGLQEQPAADGKPGLTLDSNTVFLVTGAAGSIVSAITADLATASGGTFYLLDLVPEPDPANPDLKRFVTDKDGLKRDLFARIQARGERATPALVEKELAGLERAQAARNAIDAVHAAGGTAHYFSVNLTDAEAVTKIIQQVRERSGHIDVLLHAAGTERSHFLPDKDAREFDLVFDVKSDGWFNLLHAIGDMPLGATVSFSSIAGRFGNAGQTDYSSANDLLCKITSSFRTTRPATRGIVIDWSAWGGIGMATRGSIPKMMELAGIDMLPPEAGIPLIRRELTTGGTRGEIVVGQRLGVLLNEWDSAGGLDTSAAEILTRSGQGPIVGKLAAVSLQSGLKIETTLDPTIQPFLHDHQIDGTPVLPGVMGIEAFAEAALSLLPGWHIEAIEDVNFLAPFKFYKKQPRTVTVEAVIRPERDTLLADCRLIGQRVLPNQAEPQVTTHFTARVRLTKQAPKKATVPALGTPIGHVIEAAEIYRLYFHGPAYQVVERAWWDGHRIVGLMAKYLPPNHLPSQLPTLMAPRLIELCFQTAGLSEMGTQGRMGLPLHIDRVSSFLVPDADGTRLYAVVTSDQARGSFDAEIVDAKGNRYLQLGGYRTVAVPNAVDAQGLKALQAAMSLEAVAA
jgi:acyl transferase domain-containing protein/acyl carrier protein/NAD(P)-dependent dehydrogenase (short-subunit alcohol dehydrogenase family)